MNSTQLTKNIKKLVRSNHLDYVAIASVELFQDEPEGIRPTDFLPGAQSVISLGIKLSLGVQLTNKLAHHGGPRHAIYSYLWHGFGLPNLHYIDRTSLLVTRMLEAEGYIAVPVMAASPYDIRSSLMEFSNARAAVAAGLGELGVSGLALTPDAGPRARFGSVITTAKLKTDPLYDGPALCDLEHCAKLGRGLLLCHSVCPTKAIGSELEEVRVAKKRFRVAPFDRWRCMWASMGLSKDALGLRDIPMPDNVGPEEVLNGMKERDPSQASELMVISRGDYCGKCIMECPAGKPAKIEEILAKAIASK